MTSNPAEITAVEHEGNMVQFNMCGPINGKITGEAARTVLIKSGLPPPVLGQIWSLSDLDRDGHLDQREFSIAMKLTRNCLAGIPLPPSLPPSLLNVPLSGSAPRAPAPSLPPMMMMGPGGQMGPMAHGMGGMGTASPMMAPRPPMPGAYQLPGMGPGMVPGGPMGPMGMGGTPPSAFPPHYATAPRGSISSMGGIMGGSPSKAAPPLPGRPTASTFPGKQLDNWTMPQQNKLKYAQQFNGIDKQRTGFLLGPAARNALGQSGLPTHALAHVWTLSDVNKDGRLSVEEFSIAMWLIEQHKTGFALPSELPPELAAMTHHGSARSDSPATPSGEAPAQKVSTPKTFEDKRKDNYDRGQAELDRRRQQLQEEEDRRKAEIAKREREAEEKRERERQEQERRREAERQAEMERQRQMEEERLEQERKRAAERDRIRLEKEKEMKKVMLEKRKRELMAQKSAAAERTATAEQKKKTLQFQLQALTEKHTDLEGDVGKARQGIENITKEIEGMRAIRDEKLAGIAEAQRENQAAAVQAEQLAHQLLQLQGANRQATERAAGLDELISRRAAAAQRVEELKRQIDATRERNAQQRANVTAKEEELASGLRGQVDKLRGEHAAGLARAEEKRRELQGRLKMAAAAAATSAATAAHAAAAPPDAMYDAPPGDISFQQQSMMQQSWHQSPAKESPIAASPPSSLYDTPPSVPDSSFSNGHHDTSSNGPLPSSSAATVKYRSIYAFESRSQDELSFQPGDVILVFEGHAAEPGWLAGQIKEKVGWFPAAFAEPIAPVNTNVSSPMQTVPANVTPSPSLEKILEEPNASSPASAAAAALQSPTRNGVAVGGTEGAGGDETVVCVCTAQFPWKARNAGDLSFGKGDHIEVLEKTDMKWRGRKSGDGSIGWFPKSYVKVIDETPRGSTSGSRQASVVSGGGASSSATPTSGSAHSFPATSASSHSINSVIAANPGAGATAASRGSAAGTPMSAGEWYVANYDFDAAEATDLPLRAGDRILVLEKNDDWWKGSANGREGIFPANYVVPLEGATHAAAAIATAAATAAAAPPTPLQKAKVIAAFQAAGENQMSLAMDDVVFVRSKSDAGWWEGELRDAAGGIKIGWFPGDYVQLETSSSSTVTSPIGQTYVAMFDYVASQADELTFKTGDSIVVTAQTDAEWWTGHVAGTVHSGLFPANYVQPSRAAANYDEPTVSLYDAPPPEALSPTAKRQEDKLANLVKELIQTELRYHADLCLIRDLFYRSLQSVLDTTKLNAIFINLAELIDLSDHLSKRLRTDSPGTVFCAEIDRLAAFVTFCSHQTAALQTLEAVLQRPEVRRVYTVCCQAERARGLSLSYFLLLPLGRVTRYPLLFDKMFAACVSGSQSHTQFDVANQLLKSLVSEVNLSIRERDNLQMLCWSQQHVKTEGLREKIEFTSNTRNQGPRDFLHSGILYKARSGRLLVAILFSDFLLLTTPDEHLHEVDGFKVSASTEVSLSLYKTPLLLGKLEVVPVSKEKDDESSFSLKLGDDIIHLRAANRNARTLWLRQLEEAIANALISISESARKASVVTDDHPAGRLMLEVMELRDVDTRIAENSLVFRVSLGKDKALFETAHQPDLSHLRFTTQFAFSTTQHQLRLEIARKRFFAPDSPIYDEVILSLSTIVADCAQHRGPQLKLIPLKPLYTHARERKDSLKLKLVVQMFDL
ncbi:hypothetical protein PENTCL1PPCAC_18533 [Pristionchus entomophagus]|uniref:HLH domain-containing protein n=1 Tax=Pristionchus entomophagus TaxID=358040 RepID=A0AAV5TPJ0_9BILA|nr:hypothetical protein PENTCL1PPCAC_18533 [Pristionchus entomophagus]